MGTLLFWAILALGPYALIIWMGRWTAKNPTLYEQGLRRQEHELKARRAEQQRLADELRREAISGNGGGFDFSDE